MEDIAFQNQPFLPFLELFIWEENGKKEEEKKRENKIENGKKEEKKERINTSHR